MTTAFSSLSQAARHSLAEAVEALVGAQPERFESWRIALDHLPANRRDSALLQEISAWAGGSGRFLYYFKTVSATSLQALKQEFSAAKLNKHHGRAYPRLNDETNGEPVHGCLYVGSSRSLAQRIAEHLGYGSAQTYALQLRHWAGGLDLVVELACAKYPDMLGDSTIQLLEDTLWDKLRPVFGRKGAK